MRQNILWISVKMCGINGILYFDKEKTVEKEQLISMNSKMVHRGPDDEGYHLDKNLGLSVRRLSIIDLQGGHQPISDEYGRYWVALNGEIYNYLELKDELISKGHSFKTKSDTEVLVHLYGDLKEDCVEKLNGMYAFAIWDSVNKELFIASDRIGIKPLFFLRNESYFCFSSELRSLLTMDFDKQVDYSSLILYLSLLYVPYPKSIIKNVQKLEPASYIKIKSDGNFVKKRYWKPPALSSDYDIDVSKLSNGFINLLSDSIKLQLRSDVPVGTFLSGGIDSSCVVALLSKLVDGETVKTFSVGYEGHSIDERPFALEVSNKFNTDHTELYIDKKTLNDNLKRVIRYMDEPIGDSAAVPTFLLSEIARQSGVKVILNGTGGDEIFGGYSQYLRSGFTNAAKNRLRILRNYLYSFKLKPQSVNYVHESMKKPVFEYLMNINIYNYLGLLTFIKEMRWLTGLSNDVSNLFTDSYQPAGEIDHINGLMNFDLETYLVGDLLFLLDKMTMAASIEGRVPLLDHRLVELMAKIPSGIKIRNGKLKSFVKDSLSGLLPDTVLNRNKMGFGAPVLSWLNEGILNELGSFENPSPVTAELFDCKKLKEIVACHKFDRWNAQFIYNLAIFDFWMKEVLEK